MGGIWLHIDTRSAQNRSGSINVAYQYGTAAADDIPDGQPHAAAPPVTTASFDIPASHADEVGPQILCP